MTRGQEPRGGAAVYLAPPMRRPLVSLVFALPLLACAAAPPPCDEGDAPSVVLSAAPPVTAATAATASPSLATKKESLCFARGAPRPRPPRAKSADPFCDGLDGKELAKVEARLKKELVPDYKPSKLVIDFGCNEAYGELREVVFEDGSGHGGTLRIARFVPDEQGYRVRVIDSSHYYDKKTMTLAGQVSAPKLDAVLAGARVAMLARPHFVRLHDPKDAFGSMSMGFSSNDFHLRLTLRDEAGNMNDAGFTGYDASSEQVRILPMRMASEPVQKLLETVSLKEEPPSEDDRAFFTERLLVTLEGEPFWWVRERYLKLAAELGTVDALPALANLAASPVPKGGSSEERSRGEALDAIAAISGWDPRKGERGEAVEAAAAGEAAARECAAGR